MSEVVIAKPYSDVTIEFREKPYHSYLVTWDGHFEKQKFISVTGVTGVLDKPALKFWAANLTADHILQNCINEGQPLTVELIEEARNKHTQKTAEAADVGTAVHDYGEKILKGLPAEIPDDPAAQNGIKALLRWMDQSGVKPEKSEDIIFSKSHLYVGKCDLKAKVAKKRRVIDFKTTNGLRNKKTGELKGVYLEHRYQTAAYQHALEEMYGEKFGNRIILQVDKQTGEFVAYELEDYEKDFEGFAGLLIAARRKVEAEKQPIAKVMSSSAAA